ncbi:MAG: hypothetical protein ACPG1C_04870 [Alphaproteobacteria bacterium]
MNNLFKGAAVGVALLMPMALNAQDLGLGAAIPQALDGDEAIPVTITGVVGGAAAEYSECGFQPASGALAWDFSGNWDEVSYSAAENNPFRVGLEETDGTAYKITGSEQGVTLNCLGSGSIDVRFATNDLVNRSLGGLATAPDGDPGTGTFEARYGSIQAYVGPTLSGPSEAEIASGATFLQNSFTKMAANAIVGFYMGTCSGDCSSAGSSNLNARTVTLSGTDPVGNMDVRADLFAGAPYVGTVSAVSVAPAIYAIFDNGVLNAVLPLPAGFGAP